MQSFAWDMQSQCMSSSPSLVLLQVVIVPDQAAVIASEVRAASDAFEIVVTAGGVGPTLDDVTLAGVAEALGKPLVRCGCHITPDSR